MRRLIIAALTATIAISPIAAKAQDNTRGAGRDWHDQRRDSNRDDHGDRDRNGRDRRDARDWRGYRNYDWNRPDRGGAYYADRYYRDGRYYHPRRLYRTDRIYRGNDGRYYCRRSDGTTGLIIGAAAGGLLGNSLANGRSSTLATLLGAGAGAALGSSIDRGQVQCR
jgi:Ni/Co efflux regulator RcnB